jgi:class I fructose-bisphosphate aldolase
MTATLSAPESIESWLGEEGEDLLIYQAESFQTTIASPWP